jgi:hypothetical protein
MNRIRGKGGDLRRGNFYRQLGGLDEGEFFGAGEAFEGGFALQGGAQVATGFGEFKDDGPTATGVAGAAFGVIVLVEPAQEVVGDADVQSAVDAL